MPVRQQKVLGGVAEITDTKGVKSSWSKADVTARGLETVGNEIAQKVAREPEEVRMEFDGNGDFLNIKYGIFGEDE